MNLIEVELFTALGNNAIVRMPGRAFPGVVVQGDTLASVRAHVVDAARQLTGRHGAADPLDHLRIVLDELDAMLDRYEQVLADHHIRLPYTARQQRPSGH